MAQLKTVFLATTLKSEQAKVAQYMELMNLDGAAYFVIKERDKRMREMFFAGLRDLVLTQIPLISKRHPQARRTLVICKADVNSPNAPISDALNIEDYRNYLKDFYGPQCRISVRICRRFTFDLERVTL